MFSAGGQLVKNNYPNINNLFEEFEQNMVICGKQINCLLKLREAEVNNWSVRH